MDRTSTPRGDVAKEKILQHAVQIFSQRGFDGFTTRELSARAGVNIAAINYYFGHKQGLYDAAIDEVYRRLKERGDLLLASEVAPRLFAGGTTEGGLPRKMEPAQTRAIVGLVYEVAQEEATGVRLLVRQVLDAGHLTSHTHRHYLPNLETAAGLVSAGLGIPSERSRANIVAFSFLLSRYVLQDDASLLAAFGVKSIAEAKQRVVDSLYSALMADK